MVIMEGAHLPNHGKFSCMIVLLHIYVGQVCNLEYICYLFLEKRLDISISILSSAPIS